MDVVQGSTNPYILAYALKHSSENLSVLMRSTDTLYLTGFPLTNFVLLPLGNATFAILKTEKEEADTIRTKVSLTLQNSKPPKDNLSKDEWKAVKELQSDTSIVILPADKGSFIVILNREDYLEKCINHISNGTYQLLKKDPTTKVKTKTLKQLKVLKDNDFINNKLYYYLKPTDSPPAPRFYGQPKIHKPGVLMRPIVSCSGSLLHNLTNT